jgi:hypothetical protein
MHAPSLPILLSPVIQPWCSAALNFTLNDSAKYVYTFFVPTNEAFNSTLARFANTPLNGSDVLLPIITDHIFESVTYTTSSLPPLLSHAGSGADALNLTVSQNGPNVTLTTPDGTNATIITPDIIAGNGSVVHIIDSVLLSPGLASNLAMYEALRTGAAPNGTSAGGAGAATPAAAPANGTTAEAAPPAPAEEPAPTGANGTAAPAAEAASPPP